MFFTDTLEDSLGRVPLLLRRAAVIFQYLMNHRKKRSKLRLPTRLRLTIPPWLVVSQNFRQRVPAQHVLAARGPSAQLVGQQARRRTSVQNSMSAYTPVPPERNLGTMAALATPSSQFARTAHLCAAQGNRRDTTLALQFWTAVNAQHTDSIGRLSTPVTFVCRCPQNASAGFLTAQL